MTRADSRRKTTAGTFIVADILPPDGEETNTNR